MTIKDWQVELVTTTPGDIHSRGFPLRVIGINLNCKPYEYGRNFVWDVSGDRWQGDRYDLRGAVISPSAVAYAKQAYAKATGR